MSDLMEYEHPTDYVVIPVVMRDRIMARLNAAEARVKELEGERDEAREALVWAWEAPHPSEAPEWVMVAVERARAAERVLRGEEER